MSDLRHLQRLLNELQPHFLKIVQSHGPAGGPVISLQAYGKDHMVDTFPTVSVASDNNDPVSLTLTGMPNDYTLYQPSGTTQLSDGPGDPVRAMTPSDLPGLELLGNPGINHGSTLADYLLTLTATDTVTHKSSQVSFNFIAPGPDATLPNPYPPSLHQMQVFEHYMNIMGGNTAPVPLAPTSGIIPTGPVTMIEGNMPLAGPAPHHGHS